jgi:hypothetical protein
VNECALPFLFPLSLRVCVVSCVLFRQLEVFSVFFFVLQFPLSIRYRMILQLFRHRLTSTQGLIPQIGKKRRDTVIKVLIFFFFEGLASKWAACLFVCSCALVLFLFLPSCSPLV